MTKEQKKLQDAKPKKTIKRKPLDILKDNGRMVSDIELETVLFRTGLKTMTKLNKLTLDELPIDILKIKERNVDDKTIKLMLRRAGIDTIGQAMDLDEKKLLKIRGIGVCRAFDIRKALEDLK